VQLRSNNPEWVEEARKRLSSLGWFMKCLKEPLSRMANKQDECKGAFFEGCYKSIAILDEEALLTVCAYIDLNPVSGWYRELARGKSTYIDQGAGGSCQIEGAHVRCV